MIRRIAAENCNMHDMRELLNVLGGNVGIITDHMLGEAKVVETKISYHNTSDRIATSRSIQ